MSRITRRALALSLPALPALAAWPERPVRLITTGAAGSGLDLVARILAEALSRRLGQAFTVENRAGANMLLAGEAHAQARPGETLLLAASTIASVVPFTQPGRLPFDAVADLVPVAVAAREFLCLAAHPGLPGDIAGLPALLAARAEAINWYSVPGFMELAFRLFQRQRGLDLTYVAYRGSPPAVLDLVAGRIQLAVVPLSPALSAWRAAKPSQSAAASAASITALKSPLS
jgi:tripartite-type tricarboxylate transporter receptor subunit TctC